MDVTRREMMRAAGAAPFFASISAGAGECKSGALGMVIHSFAVRRKDPSFADPRRFLEYCCKLGVDAVQVGMGIRDEAYTEDLRARAEAAGMALEGIISLPRDESDRDRFEAELRTARHAGAALVRTVALSGRRYETFDSDAAFRRFREQSRHRLELAVPAAVKLGVRLAVENHKDFRAPELLSLLHKLPAETVGVCLDTGNSLALLEEPHAVVEELAPRAFTTHFKDMAVEESPDGFHLAEVPLGEGFLDLPRIVQTLRAANPAIRFNIEMITRDPLAVPCLAESYWSTFPELPGIHLARALRNVRAHPPSRPLARISKLAPDEQLQAEDEHNRRCIEFARTRLGI
jgi:sugar phosphate isomerase/epimerase